MRHIQNHYQEHRLLSRRLLIATIGVVLILVLLVGRLVQLQVLNHTHFTTLSKDNRVRLEPLPSTRGLIYDRQGVLLAQNQPAYSLEMIPEQVPDIENTWFRLSQLIALSTHDRARFEQIKQHRRRFERIPVRMNLTLNEAARFAVVKHQFPGLDIQARLLRHYPYPAATAHLLGYVGRISQQDLDQMETSSHYAGTTHIGKIGLEKTYEETLHGNVGTRQVEANAIGRVIRVLQQQAPSPGQDLHLYLDIRLQQATLAAFGEQHGAAVALDPKTGGILAMVSKPTYNPNLFVQGISHADYQALRDNPDQPLYDRALRGQYPPGSTIKPFMGLGALEDGHVDDQHTVLCPGYFQLPNQEHKYRDWKKTGHGSVNLDEAITQSCDVYFYQLAYEMGVDALSTSLALFGFGEHTGIDLRGEARGILPSRDWKQRTRALPWYPGETVIMGIGQGYFLSTPLQLAAATAAIANNGLYHSPRLVRFVQNRGEAQPVQIPTATRRLPIRDPAHWAYIRAAMEHVVMDPQGTARSLRTADYRIAGKTGTAQVFSIKQDEEYDDTRITKKQRDHALFIAYAPVEDPQIALAVIVENGGSGSTVAVPIAHQMINTYLRSLTKSANL
ncbi:MAG: penicillin-binding protein 2 [Pseudomonadota bacterium]